MIWIAIGLLGFCTTCGALGYALLVLTCQRHKNQIAALDNKLIRLSSENMLIARTLQQHEANWESVLVMQHSHSHEENHGSDS